MWREFLKIFGEPEFKTIFIIWIILFAIWSIISIPLAFWTQSNINWILQVSGSSNQIGFWLSWLITMFTNAFTIPFNILIELIKLFF